VASLKADLAALADPRLDGAACRGQAPLFDPKGPRESVYNFRHRIAEARAHCQACPIRTVCAQIIAETPKTRRAGMWAGHYQGDSS